MIGGVTLLNRLRRSMRDRLVRVVDEVVAAHHRECETALAAHHHEYDAGLTAGIERMIRALHEVEFRSRRDLWAAGEREAAVSSERFVREVTPTARAFDHSIATLQHALSLAPPGGMALEFGVYQGRTLKVIAEARRHQQVFGFDSFQGLPEDWRSNIPAGTFATRQLPDVVGAELVVGWFSDTVADFLPITLTRWRSCTLTQICTRPRPRPSSRSAPSSKPEASSYSMSTSITPGGNNTSTEPGRSLWQKWDHVPVCGIYLQQRAGGGRRDRHSQIVTLKEPQVPEPCRLRWLANF